VLTVLVILGRLALNPSWGRLHNRHLVFLPTVMLAAWLGGFGPGLASALLSTVALDYFWTTPAQTLLHGNFELMLFLLISVAICGLVQSLHAARARADAATRSREQLLAVVAHDLRNPLSTVRMTSERIRQGAPQDEKLQHRLGTVERAILRMDHLIRDLVDSTRIEHGELALEMHGENPDSMVQEAAELAAAQATEHGIIVIVESCAGESAIVCDRDRVLQVLGNLLGNALKFTPRGGRVALRARDDGPAVRFEVADNGPGIKPEHLPHIFERYWKVDSKGTGLGLYIAWSLVRAHGGTLEARSEPGQGATFTFRLPRAPARGARR
jgi:signal transduction histidine kinase